MKTRVGTGLCENEAGAVTTCSGQTARPLLCGRPEDSCSVAEFSTPYSLPRASLHLHSLLGRYLYSG